jgi:cysteine-rich repeat protein
MKSFAVVVLGVLAGIATGCVQSQAVACGDILCPAGAVCTETGQCAFASDIAACVGKAEGETCEARGGNIGVCSAGTCSIGQCGNSIVDGGESCDDGNRVGADGCAADCSKREICGDAIADDGEACDDGNRNAVDGCDACKLTQWSAAPVVGGQVQATQVGFIKPTAVAADVNGNFYIADRWNSQIHRVDINGVISTIAGTGNAGFSGDGVVGSSAQISEPTGVAVDGLGNVYIADRGNGRIRRVDFNGIITTVAGNGQSGFGGDGGAATSTALWAPWGVAVDGLGNIYIADTENNRIRRVDVNGIISTIAGTGVAGFSGDNGPGISARLAYPTSVAVDDVGNVYIADLDNDRIRRLDSNGIIMTVAGNGSHGYSGDGGVATNAQLARPVGVAVDNVGNVYVADQENQRVRRIDGNGLITTVAGTGEYGFAGDGSVALSAQLRYPAGVAVVGSGQIYIADTDNQRIRRIDSNRVINTIAGSGRTSDVVAGGAAVSAKLSFPNGVAVDAAGNVFIADRENQRIRRVDVNGSIDTIAGGGPRGDSGDGGSGAVALLNNPSAVAADGLGNVYIADTYNCRIRRVDGNGIIATVAGNGYAGFSGDGSAAVSAQVNYPFGVAVDTRARLYIADSENHRIRRLDSNGVITTVAGTGVSGYGGDGGAATSAMLSNPTGLAVDAQGNMFIVDKNNHRIRKVSTNGLITTVAGTGVPGYSGDGGAATSARLAFPAGVAIDAGGNLFIADTDNHRIRRVSNGVITTVAGTDGTGYAGDGGNATSALLNVPAGVAVDSAGNLYISDNFNHRIRRVDNRGVITTMAGGAQLSGPSKTTRVENVTGIVRTGNGVTYLAISVKGIVTRLRNSFIDQVAGRSNSNQSTDNLARFRDGDFGDVAGIAWDESAQLLYLTESSYRRSAVWAVTPVNPDDPDTWTIASLVNDSGTLGFEDGPAAQAELRNPTGLWLDEDSRTLYIADTGNHAIRALDLNSKTVTTVVNSTHSLGFAGDGAAATAALLYQPQALTKCANGDLFIADTGNNRIRRVAAGTGLISTVVGDGVPASSGQGAPATIFPVDSPLGVACDAANNLFISSSTTVRLLPASTAGIVDGSGDVQTIYGAAPRNAFPASETSCLTGIIAPTATTLQVADSCSGLVVELTRIVAQI